MENDNKSFWQRFAWAYDPVMKKSSARLYRDICDRIRPELNREMNVLELACGSGQVSFSLSGSVRLWEAKDFSEAIITEAKKKNTSRNLHFSVQDATALPYAPESFDAVVISNALHIMPCPEKALPEIRRVLKPEGVLFAPTFVHGENRGFRLRVRLMELAGFHTYHKWKAEEFAAYIAGAGFAVIHQETLGGSLAPLCCLTAEKTDAVEQLPLIAKKPMHLWHAPQIIGSFIRYKSFLQFWRIRFVPAISASTKSIIRFTFAACMAGTSLSHKGLTCFSIPSRYFRKTRRRSCKSSRCWVGVNMPRKKAAMEKIFVS